MKTIELNPKIACLVEKEVIRCNRLTQTRKQTEPLKPITADEVVNEILWLALRSGDVSHHYSFDEDLTQPDPRE